VHLRRAAGDAAGAVRAVILIDVPPRQSDEEQADFERALTAVGTGAAHSILNSAREAQSTLVTSSADAANQIKVLSADVERTLSAAGTSTADAIVTGDLPALQKLLSEDAALVRARSGRDHRSTLLHYVSANGVEDFRQKTPPNIVEITRTLLDSGADINAESDAYGGRSTTVDLTATSYHPQAAGVQIPLLALLLDRGARVDGNSVVACLQNGRGAAAEFLAAHCTSLDLEGAAGIGRVDIVDALFDSSTETQRTNGLAWACEFGRPAVVETLLRRGVPVAAALPHHGQTGLHWAAFGGHAPVVGILLRHGAPVNSLDASFGGTPLQWALYGWGSAATPSGTGDYYDAVAALAKAGAKLDTVWFEGDDDERRRAIAKLRADPRMLAALEGR